MDHHCRSALGAAMQVSLRDVRRTGEIRSEHCEDLWKSSRRFQYTVAPFRYARMARRANACPLAGVSEIKGAHYGNLPRWCGLAFRRRQRDSTRAV
jgi:hypothetical protein